MVDNIVRHIQMGEPPLQAAITGSRDVGFTIVSMTTMVSLFGAVPLALGKGSVLSYTLPWVSRSSAV